MFPFTTILPVAQIVLVTEPVKTGKTFNATVTVESQLLAPTVNTSVPVGVAALYVLPLITILPVAQIVLVTEPVKTGKTVKLIVTVESRLNGPTLVNISVPVGVAAL